jgi:hypothetical protein
MSPRWLVILTGLLPLAGCLQEGPLPAGLHLVHGQNIESPEFLKVGDETMVRYRERISYPTTTKEGVVDLWLSSLDGSVHKKILANCSEAWPEQGPYYNTGDRYFMVDEHLTPSNNGEARVATLVRLGPTFEEEFRLEGIANYRRVSVPIASLYTEVQAWQTCPGFPELKDDCPQLFYERPAEPDQKYPMLYLWDGLNHFPIGRDVNSMQFQQFGNGHFYFLLDEKRTLTRLNRPGNGLQSLRDNVLTFAINGDARYAALIVSDDPKTKTVIRNLITGIELTPAIPNPTGWGTALNGLFGDDAFYYWQNPTSTAPAELHKLDLITGQDTFVTLPYPLVNLTNILDRPNANEWLLMDSMGHGVFTRRNDLVPLRTLPRTLMYPAFSPDPAQRFIVYIQPATSTLYDTSIQGAIMFQDAELLTLPPTMVSPPGLLVSTKYGPDYKIIGAAKGLIFAFWAHLGRASSDLYYTDYTGDAPPTNLRLVAKSIVSVGISEHNLFGILNMSQQDGVGDLVFRDIDKQVDTLYAKAVAQVVQCPEYYSDVCGNKFLYIVRGRTDSDRSGLWLATLTPPAKPDGSTE